MRVLKNSAAFWLIFLRYKVRTVVKVVSKQAEKQIGRAKTRYAFCNPANHSTLSGKYSAQR